MTGFEREPWLFPALARARDVAQPSVTG